MIEACDRYELDGNRLLCVGWCNTAESAAENLVELGEPFDPTPYRIYDFEGDELSLSCSCYDEAKWYKVTATRFKTERPEIWAVIEK